jgi:hypothetical protein
MTHTVLILISEIKKKNQKAYQYQSTIAPLGLMLGLG